ncbi:MAG: glycosyltransferase family 39 protein [Pseudomonadota bacterium]
MPLVTAQQNTGVRTNYLTTLLAITALVVVWRAFVVVFTPLDLFYDEAQYWYWAQDLAFGYFSKPPLVALQIAATTAVCGDSEACVRISAPFAHGISTLLLFGFARSLYDQKIAFFAALGYLLAFAVSASSLLVSTDVLLLVCWISGLWAFSRFLEEPTLKFASLFALAVAVGLNAKYAMIYMPLCAVGYLLFERARRPLLKLPTTWLALGLGLVGFIPNLIWNVQNDFITFTHTGGNISGEGMNFNPLSLLGFWGSQFLVATPIAMAAFIALVAFKWRSARPECDRFLLWFSIPILALLSVQAFQASANYNWAATAYPALIVLVTAVLMHEGRFKWVRSSLIVGGAFAFLLGFAALAVLAIRPDHPIASRTNLEDMFGWEEHAAEISAQIALHQPDVIATLGRRYAAGFSYYLRDRPEPITALTGARAVPTNHFQLVVPWSSPEPGERVMILSSVDMPLAAGAELVATVEATASARPFRSNTYVFIVEGVEEVD